MVSINAHMALWLGRYDALKAASAGFEKAKILSGGFLMAEPAVRAIHEVGFGANPNLSPRKPIFRKRL